MLKRIIAAIRRRNRERLARRRLRREDEKTYGWLRAPDARRRLLASLARNDTAILEALVSTMQAMRDDRQAQRAAEGALSAQLAAIDERVRSGLERIQARLDEIEARLVRQAGAQDAPEPAPLHAAPRLADAGANGAPASDG